MFLDVLRQRSGLRVLSMKETKVTAALPNTNYDLFVIFGSVPTSTSVLFSSDIGLVHFDSTVQHRAIYFFHGSANAMAEIPCRLVGTLVLAPYRALELHRAHSLLGFAKQKSCEEPLLERQVGVIEDRASSNCELIITILTVKELLFCFQFYDRHLAAQALDTAGPTETDKEFAAFFISIEQIYNVN